MTEEKGGKARRDPIEKASGNLEKALETISKRLLEQIKDGETPSRELGELAKVMKQAVEIRQELQEEHGGQETGVRVVFEREAEEFSEGRSCGSARRMRSRGGFYWTGTGTSPTAGPEAAGRAGLCAQRRSCWRCGMRGSSF